MSKKKLYTGSVPELFSKEAIQIIRRRLVSKQETISVAESVTAGLLQVALASAEEASRFFQGGVTTYNVGQKTLQLNVEPIHAIATNCVSKGVTSEMAINVAARFRSQWAVGVTGFATPVPESNETVFAWYAIAHYGKIVDSRKIDGMKGPALACQLLFANAIL